MIPTAQRHRQVDVLLPLSPLTSCRRLSFHYRASIGEGKGGVRVGERCVEASDVWSNVQGGNGRNQADLEAVLLAGQSVGTLRLPPPASAPPPRFWMLGSGGGAFQQGRHRGIALLVMGIEVGGCGGQESLPSPFTTRRASPTS
ncbi:hypothetical protein E2562_012948 [Oryza meyeriana var. granulata]|uniref:Uncharacterized protein n=1 Tax=Oryza meyeriana var. granulata TaxID=110450 RepID=A0A6G1DIK5_9ORYZ|nr:hypothetical protein E2562_012948 [Oryza meyeriana var. granulata]